MRWEFHHFSLCYRISDFRNEFTIYILSFKEFRAISYCVVPSPRHCWWWWFWIGFQQRLAGVAWIIISPGTLSSQQTRRKRTEADGSIFRSFLLLSQNCNQDRYCTLLLERLRSRSVARSLALALALSLVALLAFLDLELSAFGSAKVSLLRGRLAALFSVRPLNSKDLEAISGMLALLWVGGESLKAEILMFIVEIVWWLEKVCWVGSVMWKDWCWN